MTNYNHLEEILNILVWSLKKQDFLVYFRKISILEITDGRVIFGVVSVFMKKNLEVKFLDEITKATTDILPSVKNIEFQVDKNIDNTSNINVIDCMSFYKDFKKKSKKTKSTSLANTLIEDKNAINIFPKTQKRYTLENFIVWPSNQLPYSACEAVVRKPWTAYNPLYIYGDVGLWKTHLLQWTGLAIGKKHKGKNVRYMTSDTFISEYVEAVKKKSVPRLRSKYREADVLIIDDIQFLQRKEQTQNELYNIFNILYDSNKQIIISWDRAPKELTELEPRLRSRFEWGIIVDVGTPDYETRLAILQEKAREREFLIPQDITEFIRANVQDNVREIEGILNQLIAEYELTHSIPSLEKIAKKLKKLSFTTDLLWWVKSDKQITIKSYEDIIDAVSNHFGIEKEWILWMNRKKEFMIPRQVAMYLLKTKLNYTYERIWNIFSGRNHRSVLYSCKKVEDVLKKDRALLFEINTLRDSIGI